MISQEMDSWPAKRTAGSKLLNFGAAFQGISRVTFAARKGKKKMERANLETQRRTNAKTSFNVTQRPRGKGFILTSPVNLQGFTLRAGGSRASAVKPDTLSNFCSFNVLGKRCFSWSDQSVVGRPHLNFKGRD